MRVINILIFLVLTGALSLMLYVWFILLFPFSPVTLNVNPFKTEKLVYKQGEDISFVLDFTKKLPIAPKVNYFIVDGIVYPLTQNGGASRPVGKNKPTINVTIPMGISPGKYLLQIDLEYKISPLRTIYISWQSNKFDVIKKGADTK